MMATFDNKKQNQFFNLSLRKIDYFREKQTEKNLGRDIANNIAKNIKIKKQDK